MEMLGSSSAGAERPMPRPGQVRDASDIEVGATYQRFNRNKMVLITVLTDPIMWEGEENLGRYVEVETILDEVHARDQSIPARTQSRMFLSDVGLEPYADGGWNQQSYLAESPEAAKTS
jgi:hypothetical protein